jgi:hypothetical protein
MQKKAIFFFVTFVSFTSLFVACGSDDNDKDPIPDVSNIPVEIKLSRFEQDLFAIDTNNIASGVAELRQKQPLMYDIYIHNVINDNRVPNATDAQIIGGFIKNKSIRQLSDTVKTVYKDIADLDKEFTQAFKFYKYYYPKKMIPQVATFISEYGYGGFTLGDSLLGVGLDLYLGANHSGYDPNYFPRYSTRAMNREHIVAKSMEVVARNLVGDPMNNRRLLDAMIQNGKILYMVDKFLPYTPDSIKFEYTSKQMTWCNENEAQTWAYLLDEKLLYSVKPIEWAKLVNPSPTGTTKMPIESPGRVGNWMGYRIVRAYMRKYPNTTLEQLANLKDAQKLLDDSKYKPKRK